MKNLFKRILKIIIEYLFMALIVMGLLYICLHFIVGVPEKFVLTKEHLSFLILFTFLLTFILSILLKGFILRFGKKKFIKKPLSKIDKMTGEEFEEYLGLFFEKRGFTVEYTPKSNDYGADLLLTKKGELIAVQAKRYEAHVGNAAIQEVVAAKDYYEADRCIVVTNSYFTKNAIGLAEANNVELWDRDILERF